MIRGMVMAGRQVNLLLALCCLVLLTGCRLLSGGVERRAPEGTVEAVDGALDAQALSGLAVSPVIHQGDVWLMPAVGGEPVLSAGTPCSAARR